MTVIFAVTACTGASQPSTLATGPPGAAATDGDPADRWIRVLWRDATPLRGVRADDDRDLPRSHRFAIESEMRLPFVILRYEFRGAYIRAKADPGRDAQSPSVTIPDVTHPQRRPQHLA